MEAKTIVELHQEIKNNTLDIEAYYKYVFNELEVQQKRINALTMICESKAYQDIKNVVNKDNMLAYIPAVFKDNYNTKGLYTTASSRMLEDYIPVYDATVVEKLHDAGTCLVAKASLDELAMGGTNKSALTGAVLNPYDTTRISGGSSGGSAAIVASGAVPYALGSDTGDSIRKPAGYCGVVGFKPTWGRISRFGVIPYASSLDTVGAFTRTVSDMAIVIEAMAGRDDRDMTSSHKDVPNYFESLNKDISSLKIGVLQSVVNELNNETIKDNFNHVVDTCKKLGATCTNIEMDNTLLKALVPTYKIIANSEATSNHSCLDGIKYGLHENGASTDEIMIESRTKGFGKAIRQRFVLGNLALATENQEKMFRQAQKVRRLIVDELQKLYEEYDIILTPNAGSVAPKLDDASDNRTSSEYLILENHLLLGNFAGLPSLTIPSGFVDHMPIAVNIMGRLFEEQTVLNVGYALEQEFGLENQYNREGV